MLTRRLNQLTDGSPEEAQGTVRGLLDAGRMADVPSDSVNDWADRLAHVDLTLLRTDEEKSAFWINLYNAMMRHILLEFRPTGRITARLHLFFLVKYRVGPYWLSLQQIEHGVLRRNARMAPLPCRAFRVGDERLALLPERLDPRIHFALNCGAISCPPIRAYTPEALDAQLTLATQSYLSQHTTVDARRGHVTLPYLCRLYLADFGGVAGALDFAARHLDGESAQWLAQRGPAITVSYGPYNWLTEPH